MEVSDHGGKREVIHRVVVVENGLGQGAVLFEAIKECSERGGLRPVADGIAADVRADGVEEAGIVVALRANVKLHGPAFGGVKPA